MLKLDVPKYEFRQFTALFIITYITGISTYQTVQSILQPVERSTPWSPTCHSSSSLLFSLTRSFRKSTCHVNSLSYLWYFDLKCEGTLLGDPEVQSETDRSRAGCRKCPELFQCFSISLYLHVRYMLNITTVFPIYLKSIIPWRDMRKVLFVFFGGCGWWIWRTEAEISESQARNRALDPSCEKGAGKLMKSLGSTLDFLLLWELRRESRCWGYPCVGESHNVSSRHFDLGPFGIFFWPACVGQVLG